MLRGGGGMTEIREAQKLYRVDEAGRVIGVHNYPATLDSDKRTGYLLDTVPPPAPVCTRGEEPVLYIRTDEKLGTLFEWRVEPRELTPEEQIAARFEALEARLTALEGGAVR
jgi:hypothetical protein